MTYEVNFLDPVLEQPEIDMEGSEGSETEIESGKASDETLSFLKWKLKGDMQNSNPARDFYKKGATRLCLAATCSLLPWIISFLLAVTVVALAVQLESKTAASKSEIPTDMMYTLGDEAVEYRMETTYASEDYPDSEYQGWPNDRKDKLWDRYEDGNYFWVNASTASKLPFPTEHAPAEGHTEDYIVGLSVFHVLHCLSVLRRHIYPRRYNSSMVNADGTVDFGKWHHVDHCLETVRRDILCHADTGATTWEWIDRTQMTIRPETKHVCRNFDKISEWAYERHIKASQRAHVEGGKIVDYTGLPPSDEWNKIAVTVPKDWAYTVEDL
ncbi:unnamed protein product [Discula destructiva]